MQEVRDGGTTHNTRPRKLLKVKYEEKLIKIALSLASVLSLCKGFMPESSQPLYIYNYWPYFGS